MGGIGELAELARQEERHLLADVDGVVADPLELPGHDVHPDPPLEASRVPRQLHDLPVHSAVQIVDRVVHHGELLTELEVSPGERVDRGSHHADHDVAHLLEPDRMLSSGGRSAVASAIFEMFTAWSPTRSRCRLMCMSAE